MTVDYNQFLREHRRLIILRILKKAPSYTANESLITQVVQEYGNMATRDQVRTELIWLQEKGFVKVDDVADLYIAEITIRGIEVAKGIAVVPGIQQPSPKS